MRLLSPPRWLTALGTRFMPFADAASPGLPLGRLMRLALFQAVIGMVTALLVGTLNRVMIIELQVPAWWVALAVAVPMVFAPLRALIGYGSDTHPSALGLRRIPYLWTGSLLLFGGLAVMPFALLLLSEAVPETVWLGRAGAALAFILVGAGLQVTQTAGMALANDLAPADKRPRVVALLYSMLLIGLIASSTLYALVLADFSPVRLIQVIQGSAAMVIVLNLVSLWKQEARGIKRGKRETGGFSASWRELMALPQMRRFLWTVGLGSLAFSMQDIVLEPYGAEILGLDVSSTSALTALGAGGSLLAFTLSARWLTRGWHACRVAALGVVLGLPAFAFVIFAAPLQSAALFRAGVMLIGFGSGLFAVGMLVTAMSFENRHLSGLVLGTWGAVQATATGAAMALGGALRDGISGLAQSGTLGDVLNSPVTGYSVVYHIEIYLLFVVLIALGPLLRNRSTRPQAAIAASSPRFGLAEMPG
jgi:BCD family chlorophyll transporter-like MFS transporter